MSSLVEDYLQGYNGSVHTFRDGMNNGQRLGQAFFNALHFIDRAKIRGTSRDPFYKDTKEEVYLAIEWLMDHESNKLET